MSTPLERDDDFNMSSDLLHASTNDLITDGPGESSQSLDGAEVTHNVVPVGAPQPGPELGLPPNIAQVEPQKGVGTLEDLLASWQDFEHAEAQLGATPWDASFALDMNSMKQTGLEALAFLYGMRFEKDQKQEDLDVIIDLETKGLHLAPDNGSERTKWLSRLGQSYLRRHEQLDNVEDLGRGIDFMEQAVSHAPLNHPEKPEWLNYLGGGYLSRFEHLGKLDDLDRSVNCLEQAVMLTPDGHSGKPMYLGNLGSLCKLVFQHLGRLDDLDRSVNCLEQAVMLTPDGHSGKPAWLNKLGISYRDLFERLGRLDDLDRSVNYLEQAVMLTPDGHSDKPARLNNLGGSYHDLFEHLGRLDDLDRSVNCFEQAVMLTPDGHPHKPAWLSNLGSLYQLVSERLGRQNDLDRSVNCKEQAVMLTPDGHPDRPVQLGNLGSSYHHLFKRLGRPDDLDRAVNCLEQAVALTPDGHLGKPKLLNNLGLLYTAQLRYLDQPDNPNCASIRLKLAEQIPPDDHPDKSIHLQSLARLHLYIGVHLQLPKHILDGIHFCKAAALSPTGPPAIRLQSSHAWAALSHILQLPSLEAYAHCMTLLPLVVWLGTSVQQRYERLTRDIRSLITEAAAAAISLQQHTLAVDWLEQGRSIVWGQTLQLRTPYDDLHAVQPELAKELQDVSYQLECSSLSQPADQVSGEDGKYSHEISWKHRRLAARREELLASARLLPGLEDFLCPLKASKIMDLVQDGIVVIVNLHNDQCDALIIQAGTQAITHVPLIGFSAPTAKSARSCLSAHGSRRGFKVDYDERIATLKGILAMLWYDVVKPVLDHVGITEVLPADKLPHITWCTTGPLSFLPLHAAGDYSHPNSVLSNLAISSYTPTISALGQRAIPPGPFSGILAVGHASSIRGLNALPGTKAELDQVEKQAGTLPFTRLDEGNACTDAVLKAMQDHSWVHFACHGSQNAHDPMKSALHLHDGDLDLATIARNPLKNAQLAFLSACQTATGDSDLPDESIHLAAGLLMAGYSSVIATMWSIDDGDAPLVAEKVYECLLEDGVPNSRKAALALHKAVANLRETIGVDQFGRWVPYIHIGR